MSSRITRSSAKGSADSSTPANVHNIPSQPSGTTTARKRKASSSHPPSDPTSATIESPTSRRAKRVRVTDSNTTSAPSPTASRTRRAKKSTAMSHQGQTNDASELPTVPSPTSATLAPSSKKKAARAKKTQGPGSSNPSTSRTRKSKKPNLEDDISMNDFLGEAEPEQAKANTSKPPQRGTDGSEGNLAGEHSEEEGDDTSNPFSAGNLRRHGGSSLSHSLRALSGVLSGTTGRLRGLLEKLRQKDDPSIQLIALQEFSELLLVSSEDNLAGTFSPDAYVKELVMLMQPNEFGFDNPEIMLLACRCLANMMEALPSSAAAVVYGGAVPILCQKLLEIDYIDLAEQALSTLEKISVEFPGHIVREGGLTACLTYLDFFATGTQRTAVTTAANCCRNIPEDSFPVVRDVMPILLNVLNSNDQKVLEQGCLCVSRIVESFRWSDAKLEELVDADMLKAINRLLLPGTTNLIGANIHTLFLRVLAFVARSSPRRSVELLKMNVVDTLHQILTGVSPPSGGDHAVTKIDPVIIMQALIHRPRDQIFETLNVICELLPDVPSDGLLYLDVLLDAGYPGRAQLPLSADSKKPKNAERLELLEGCKDELQRFTVILLPTLTDAYSSTVNLAVRQKVLTAQLKMLSNIDTYILEDALRNVSYISFLAAILSQHDHHILVTYALQAAELLLKRLGSIYRYQFYREGVVAEIMKLADRPLREPDVGKDSADVIPLPPPPELNSQQNNNDSDSDEDIVFHEDEDDEDGDDSEDADEEEEVGNEDEDEDEDETQSESTSSPGPPPRFQPSGHTPKHKVFGPDDIITQRAKLFMEAHEKGSDNIDNKASTVLEDLRIITNKIQACSKDARSDVVRLFKQLAAYFNQDQLESITSYELLSSDVVNSLLEVLSGFIPDNEHVRMAFLEAFMDHGTQTEEKTSGSKPTITPFSILVHKLQDLLSRSEHFEVITVHHNGYDSSRGSATSMLAKQLKLSLTASDSDGIPRPFRQFTVTIHAIATFKALDEFLRQRITLAERPKPTVSRAQESLLRAMEMAGAMSGATTNREAREAFLAAFGSPSASPGDLTNQVSKRTPISKAPHAAPALPPQTPTSATANPDSGPRKTSRATRKRSQLPPVPPPPPARDETGDSIECADEAHLTDDETDEETALETLVNEMEEDMESEDEEPSAVNMEIASTGKVTARRDDGTRVATPLGNKKPTDRSAPLTGTPSNLGPRAPPPAASTPSKAMSYAAAIQSVPQDWHLEFSVNGQRISNDTTVYRAVHFDQAHPNDVSSRNMWSATHQISYKKVAGPPPVEQPTRSSSPEPSADGVIPASIARNPAATAILRLLDLLHGLNANIDDILVEKKDLKLKLEPASQFVNTKLTAKLNRQLEEPLIVSSNCLPNWSEDLARLYPFLFPFETRHLFLQSTSFGYSRSMNRWQSSQANDSRHDRHRDERPYLGKPQRQKVRISRHDILKAAIKVMELYGSSPAILEVEYFEEVGTGLGPTLEFYSSVSKEFAKKKLLMWRENESSGSSEYAFGSQGLFPSPMSDKFAESENGKKILALFESMGKFVARSMLDSRIIDIHFNPIFFRIALSSGGVSSSLGAVHTVDKDLANSLRHLRMFVTAKKAIEENSALSTADKAAAIDAIEVNGAKVDDLALDFTLPGYPNVELLPNGATVSVTIDNVSDYIKSVIDLTVNSGVRHQLVAFKNGFSEVFPFAALRAFRPDELVMLFGQSEEDWSLETLMDSIKADHGYNLDSRSVKDLMSVMSGFSMVERRAFLLFVTGSPKLPIGGFKALTPMFTVVCKPSEAPYTSDDYLPSVMTCVNYLKLPNYSTVEVMREKLGLAIREGQGAFHLS